MNSRAALGIGIAIGVAIFVIPFAILNLKTTSLQFQSISGPSSTNVTIPIIHGYYNGRDVYFMHTEVSDKEMAERLSDMVSFSVIYSPDLAKAIESTSAKVYVFKNGIKGSGPYGGGPFGFQDDVFNSVPGTKGYSPLKVAYIVTWKDNATLRVLKSEEDILHAQMLGELMLERTNVVVNMPMIRW